MTKEEVAAYVINRRVYQETSLIVDLFTLEEGKLSIIAKGALRAKNDAGGLLQAFQPLVVSYSGRSNLKTLRSVEVSGRIGFLESTYLYCGYYVNELIDRLLPVGEASTSLFGLYIRTINELSSKCDQNASLRLFEYGLLSELGLIPDFQRDAQGNEIDAKLSYLVSHENGFEPVFKSSINRSQLISKQYGGDMLLAISRATSSDELKEYFESNSTGVNRNDKITNSRKAKESKELMRDFIAKALNGAEIKTRSMFKKIKI